jgi:pilus assembly protein Flp/PilA
MLKKFRGLKKNRKGQSLVEYGLILALVSVVSILVLTTLGSQIQGTIQKVNNQLQNAVPTQ